MSQPDTHGSGTPRNEFQPVGELNYEAARDELIETVKILELGQMSLDESLAYWERGEALAKRCEEQLARASARVENALEDADANGEPGDADPSAHDGAGEEE